MKHNQHTTKKLWLTALCLGLAAAVICQCTLLSAQCTSIRSNLVRLHVLANSNSDRDQALKLKVRDAIVSYGKELFGDNTTKQEAMAQMERNIPQITQIARATLQKEGCTLPVTCKLEETYFHTRVYNTVTLPAGNYTALRVIIGQGAGNNWWCVMFPPLCIPAAEEVSTTPDSLEKVLTPGERDLVENGPQYQIKFKTVEWFQSAKERVKEWF